MNKQPIIKKIMAQTGLQNLESRSEIVTLTSGQTFSKKLTGVAVAVHGLNNSGDVIVVADKEYSISDKMSVFVVSEKYKKGMENPIAQQMVVKTTKPIQNLEAKFLIISLNFKKDCECK